MQPDTSHPLILFDGVCNLCERTVQFIVRHDDNAIFRFASLQSTVASDLLAGFDEMDKELSSVLLLSDGLVYRKSRAALHISKRLDGAWPILYYLFFWIPPFIANFAYDFVGNRRYKWFGKKEACWIPDEALQQRFIDN